MAIRLKCKCGKDLNLKDELAGKGIRCPACKAGIRVPVPGGAAATPQQSPPAQRPPAQRPAAQPPAAGGGGGVSDLFEEEGIKQLTGPVCPSCVKEMKPGTVICMNCGYNPQTGEKLQGHSAAQEASSVHGNAALDRAAEHMKRDADTQKMVAGGTGMPWWMLATVLMALAGLGVVLVLVSNAVVAEEGAEKSSLPIYVVNGICGMLGLFWIFFHVQTIIYAFKKEEGPVQGILCLAIPVYPLIYGFMRGKAVKHLFIPWLTLIILIFSIYFGFLTIFRLLGAI